MDYASGSQGVGFQRDYVFSVPGILKMIELFCDLLALILGAAAPVIDGSSGHRGFFIFVTIFALIITLTIFLLGMLNVRNFCIPTRWPLIEIGTCGLIALFYFIGSIVVATIAKYSGVYGAAAFFGFAAFIVYTADLVNNIRLVRAGPRSQPNETYAATTRSTPGTQPTY